jgi:hypothetical protein
MRMVFLEMIEPRDHFHPRELSSQKKDAKLIEILLLFASVDHRVSCASDALRLRRDGIALPMKTSRSAFAPLGFITNDTSDQLRRGSWQANRSPS